MNCSIILDNEVEKRISESFFAKNKIITFLRMLIKLPFHGLKRRYLVTLARNVLSDNF